MDNEGEVSQDIWKKAAKLTDDIEQNRIKISKDQEDRLNRLILAYNSYLNADQELKKAMIGILYERQVYISKLWLIEKIGIKNKWDHPLLHIIGKILYQDSKDFALTDKAES